MLLQPILSERRGNVEGQLDLEHILPTVIAELVKLRSAEATPSPGPVPIASSTPPVLTWIDKLFPASEALAGKKTALSVIAGTGLGVLQLTPLAIPATAAQVLLTLIGGAGGLGLLSKLDRGIDLMGVIAEKPTALEESGTRPARRPDYGGHLGDVPFWER